MLCCSCEWSEHSSRRWRTLRSDVLNEVCFNVSRSGVLRRTSHTLTRMEGPRSSPRPRKGFAETQFTRRSLMAERILSDRTAEKKRPHCNGFSATCWIQSKVYLKETFQLVYLHYFVWFHQRKTTKTVFLWISSTISFVEKYKQLNEAIQPKIHITYTYKILASMS